MGVSHAALVDPSYRLHPGPPPVADYRRLRAEAGLSPVSAAQAAAGLDGAWAACHVVRVDGEVAGMGRVLGDGGWYFHVVDMAVLPTHQRRGIGAAVLAHLLDAIRTGAPPGAYVNLVADPPGRGLYRRFGFTDTAPDGIGMSLLL